MEIADLIVRNLSNATLNDALTTFGAITVAVVAIRQKVKDKMLADRDKHIEWLEKKIDELRANSK